MTDLGELTNHLFHSLLRRILAPVINPISGPERTYIDRIHDCICGGWIANGYNTNFGSHPNRIQMPRIFCSNVGSSATISSFGIFDAPCNNSGCINTSGPITVTFP